jgi:hypothetical protein
LFYLGLSDVARRHDLERLITRKRRGLKNARVRGGPTLAAAAGSLAGQLINATILGMETDIDEVVALAEEADQAASSIASVDTLIRALSLRASQTLARQQNAWARLSQRCQRSLPPNYLIAAAMELDPRLRAAALDNPDVQRVMELTIQTGERFPKLRPIREWALLHLAHPAEAEQVLRSQHEHASLFESERRIQQVFDPSAGKSVMDCFWYYRATGHTAEAEHSLNVAAELPVPVPPL